MDSPTPRKKRSSLPDAKVEKIGIATAKLHRILKELDELKKKLSDVESLFEKPFLGKRGRFRVPFARFRACGMRGRPLSLRLVGG